MAVLAVAAALLGVAGEGSPSPKVAPELPRRLVDTTLVAPSGRTIAVAAGGNFQGALNAAQPGDVITLQAGATFTGPFALPAKPGAGWIIVRTSAPDTALPPPDTRIDPSHASVMPKIVVRGPMWTFAIRTAPGAHHFRFIGIEISPAPRTFLMTLIGLGRDAHDLIFDRCYIHGDPAVGGRIGIDVGAAGTAVIDSYLSDFKSTTIGDAQAIQNWDGPGPVKYVDNYIEASGESLNFGGQDPDIQNLVTSDVEIRGNHFAKPLSWYVHSPTYGGTHWLVKNLFEMKNARRVLVDGNLFENNWADAQDGIAIQFTPRNQSGGCPWCVVADVTFTHNIVRHVRAGMHFLGTDYNYPSQPLQRVLVQNNLFADVGAFPDPAGPCCPPGLLFLLDNGTSQNVTIDHNTAFQTSHMLDVNSPQAGLVVTNNIAGGGVAGGFSGWVFDHNAVLSGSPSGYPPGNFFPSALARVGFINHAGGDYRLVAGSPYKHAGTDGKDLGADIEALSAAQASSSRRTPPPP